MTDTTQIDNQMALWAKLEETISSMPEAMQMELTRKYHDEANGALRVLNALNQPG